MIWGYHYFRKHPFIDSEPTLIPQRRHFVLNQGKYTSHCDGLCRYDSSHSPVQAFAQTHICIDTETHICRYILETQMNFVLVAKGLVLVGWPSKNRGHWGSRYILLYIDITPDDSIRDLYLHSLGYKFAGIRETLRSSLKLKARQYPWKNMPKSPQEGSKSSAQFPKKTPFFGGKPAVGLRRWLPY